MNILLLEHRSRHEADAGTPINAMASLAEHSFRHIDPWTLVAERGQRGAEEFVRGYVASQAVDVLMLNPGYGFDFPIEYLAHDLACYKVLLAVDDDNYFDTSYRHYAQAFDLVFSTNPLVERYMVYGFPARYWGGGFFTRERRRDVQSEHPQPHDVTFIGSLIDKPNRAKYIDALMKAGIKVELFGVGTLGGYLAEDQLPNLFRSSKINLNFTGISQRTVLDRHLTINSRIRNPKGRCQHIGLAGGFILSEYAPGIERVFSIENEIDVFHDANELVQKVGHYLRSPHVRQQMAQAAHDRAHLEYAAPDYWRRFLADIEHRLERRAAPIELIVVTEFRRNYGAYRLQYFLLFLFTGRWANAWHELRSYLSSGGWREPYASLWHVRQGLAWASHHSEAATRIRAALRRLRDSLR